MNTDTFKHKDTKNITYHSNNSEDSHREVAIILQWKNTDKIIKDLVSDLTICAIYVVLCHHYLTIKDTVSQGLFVLTEVLYMVWTPSELRPLVPSVWTLMLTGTLRSRFSRIHCRKRNKICSA